MKIPRLRYKVILQSLTTLKNGLGQEDDVWNMFATVHASKRTLSQKERFIGEKLAVESSELFIIRYREGIDTQMRILFGIKSYEITGVMNHKERNRYLFLYAKEVM